MTGLRNWVVGAVALAAVLLTGGWFLGVQPALDSAAVAASSTASVTSQSQALQVKLASLSRTAAKQDQLDAEQATLVKAVPTALRANTFVRRLTTLAAQDDVTLTAITPGTGQLYVEPPSALAAASAAQAATAAATAAASPAPTPAATAAAAPAAPVVVVPVQAAVDPSITGSNFTLIPMTVAFTGSSDDDLDFVHDVQFDERLYFVSGYSASKDSGTGIVTGTLTGYIYALKR